MNESPPDLARLRRVARQELRTIALLGVDFVPVGPAIDTPLVAAAAATVRPASPSQQQQHQRSHGSPHFTPLSDDEIAALGTVEQKAAALEQLHAAHDAACPHCTATTGHARTVFGEGNANADLMFIGEAPGAEEDRTGRPFVGRAGQKLDEIITAMKLKRENVYIANVLKARPPNNRTPQPDEVARCSPYLVEQVRIIQPRAIVTLGGPATQLILETKEGITRMRGVWGAYRAGSFEIPVMPTFHPAYLLRNYTKDTRAKVWSDMQAVMQRLGMK